MTTSTQTLDKPLEDTTTGDDTPKMFHYVRKSKIAESAVWAISWWRCAGRPSR